MTSPFSTYLHIMVLLIKIKLQTKKKKKSTSLCLLGGLWAGQKTVYHR